MATSNKGKKIRLNLLRTEYQGVGGLFTADSGEEFIIVARNKNALSTLLKSGFEPIDANPEMIRNVVVQKE